MGKTMEPQFAESTPWLGERFFTLKQIKCIPTISPASHRGNATRPPSHPFKTYRVGIAATTLFSASRFSW